MTDAEQFEMDELEYEREHPPEPPLAREEWAAQPLYDESPFHLGKSKRFRLLERCPVLQPTVVAWARDNGTIATEQVVAVALIEVALLHDDAADDLYDEYLSEETPILSDGTIVVPATCPSFLGRASSAEEARRVFARAAEAWRVYGTRAWRAERGVQESDRP